MRSLRYSGALVVALALQVAGATGWETLAEGEVVIRVRERPEVPGGREVWAEGELEVSARDIQEALRDHASFRHWLPYVKESRVLATGPERSRLAYTRLDLPVISPRDYICRVVDEQLLEGDGTGEFRQRWRVVEQALPERQGVVRVRHNEGSWRVVPRGEGRSWFTYRFIVEPGGAIPGFLAGVGQKDAVLDTVRALERRARALAAQREQQGSLLTPLRPAPAAPR
jgi:hypothetical protein